MLGLMSESRHGWQRGHSEAIVIDLVTEKIKAETCSGDSGSRKEGLILKMLYK